MLSARKNLWPLRLLVNICGCNQILKACLFGRAEIPLEVRLFRIFVDHIHT